MTEIWNTDNCKQARTLAGLKVKDAANELNITPEYLSMLENGHKQPSQKLILRMADLYNVSVSYFLMSEKNLSQA